MVDHSHFQQTRVLLKRALFVWNKSCGNTFKVVIFLRTRESVAKTVRSLRKENEIITVWIRYIVISRRVERSFSSSYFVTFVRIPSKRTRDDLPSAARYRGRHVAAISPSSWSCTACRVDRTRQTDAVPCQSVPLLSRRQRSRRAGRNNRFMTTEDNNLCRTKLIR